MMTFDKNQILLDLFENEEMEWERITTFAAENCRVTRVAP